jgi:ABC-type branched-subunit amino acid transport system ATPase component
MTLGLTGVSRDFDGVHAVRGVSLVVGRGEVVGLVGPNGCGKTTLVNLASGAVAPSRGTVGVDGADLTGRSPRHFGAAGVIRTFQGVRVFEGLSVRDNVLIGAQRGVRRSLAGAWLRPPAFRRRERALRRRVDEALEAVGLASLAARPVVELSHGQRRRVEVARALAADPAYLVLDEPGAGVDPDQLDSLAALFDAARDRGVGLLLVEHDLGLVEKLSDRVLGVVGGEVVAEGSFAAVAAHPGLAAHLRPLSHLPTAGPPTPTAGGRAGVRPR